MTLVCILPSGEVALRPDRSLPHDALHPGEHPLDACLRIPLEQAGFRYQHFHPFLLDDGHLVGWVEGDRYHAASTEPVIGQPSDPTQAALAIEALADHESLPDDTFYRESVRTLERGYLSADTPQGQSGFSGDDAIWRLRRLQVADGIDRDGRFLDVGCANGFLAESVTKWCGERGLLVEPFGVDLAPRLIELARRRLPQWADRFWVGNASDWRHPTGERFDFVHVLLDTVPSRHYRALVEHHLERTVDRAGRILVSHYSAVTGTRIDETLHQLGFTTSGWAPSHDPSRSSAGTAWIDRT